MQKAFKPDRNNSFQSNVSHNTILKSRCMCIPPCVNSWREWVTKMFHENIFWVQTYFLEKMSSQNIALTLTQHHWIFSPAHSLFTPVPWAQKKCLINHLLGQTIKVWRSGDSLINRCDSSRSSLSGITEREWYKVGAYNPSLPHRVVHCESLPEARQLRCGGQAIA